MGIFSKKDKNDDFFNRLKDDVDKSREEDFLKLSDFSDGAQSFTVNNFKFEDESDSKALNPLEALKQKVKKADVEVSNDIQTNGQNPTKIENAVKIFEDSDEKEINPIVEVENKKTLLDKCKAYTVDDDGNDFSQDNTPLYELESVANILKNDSLGALDSLSKKYNITIKDETQKPEPVFEASDDNSENDEKEIESTQKTIAFEKIVDFAKNEQKSDTKVFEDFFLENNPETEIDTLEKSLPDISDIDNNQRVDFDTSDDINTQTTVRFTPVKNFDDNKTAGVAVSSFTKSIDFADKLNFDESQHNPRATKLEKNDFDDFTVENELKSFEDIKKKIVSFAKLKRLRFLLSALSFIVTIAVSSLMISPLSDFLVIDTDKSILFCIIMFGLNILLNADMFKSFLNMFSHFIKPDVLTGFLALFTAALLVLQLTDGTTAYVVSAYHTCVLASVILLFRSISKFSEVSYKLGNLKQIGSKTEKNAVSFISDESVTFSMAKNSIDGDVLIATSKKSGFIKDFLKYSEYVSYLGGKLGAFLVIALILSILSGATGFIYYNNLVASAYCATAVLCFFSIPTLFFINTLPMSSASKILNEEGAIISGVEGALQIENANAAVLSTADIFPEGSIILKDIKVLSNNNIDDTILRAASLTQAVGSTLAPIFKQIAKTNSDYVLPDSDTVKYEERLGLSGWVDNQLLFIGNRTLMESHGIEVPSIEVDKRILKKGCFPIYLATVQKACALIIVQYNSDFSVIKKIKKLTDLGVTLLFTNCDPNINEAMISDYFGIYEDSIKIVSNAGASMYKKSVQPVEHCSAPAVFKRDNLSFVRIINIASAIKKTNRLFTIIYVVASILLSVGFMYSAFSTRSSVPSSLIVLLSVIFTTLLSLILYFIKKPN